MQPSLEEFIHQTLAHAFIQLRSSATSQVAQSPATPLSERGARVDRVDSPRGSSLDVGEERRVRLDRSTRQLYHVRLNNHTICEACFLCKGALFAGEKVHPDCLCVQCSPASLPPCTSCHILVNQPDLMLEPRGLESICSPTLQKTAPLPEYGNRFLGQHLYL